MSLGQGRNAGSRTPASLWRSAIHDTMLWLEAFSDMMRMLPTIVPSVNAVVTLVRCLPVCPYVCTPQSGNMYPYALCPQSAVAFPRNAQLMPRPRFLSSFHYVARRLRCLLEVYGTEVMDWPYLLCVAAGMSAGRVRWGLRRPKAVIGWCTACGSL